MARRRTPAPAPQPDPPATDELVTLVPTGEAYIPGVPAVETTVSAGRAAELLAFTPPAFTVKPPAPAAGDTAEEITRG